MGSDLYWTFRLLPLAENLMVPLVNYGVKWWEPNSLHLSILERIINCSEGDRSNISFPVSACPWGFWRTWVSRSSGAGWWSCQRFRRCSVKWLGVLSITSSSTCRPEPGTPSFQSRKTSTWMVRSYSLKTTVEKFQFCIWTTFIVSQNLGSTVFVSSSFHLSQ